MISGAALRDFYITAWQSIPALVAVLFNEDPGMIRSSTGISKIAKSLQREVTEMPVGSIFVCYQGFIKGGRNYNEVTKHEIAAFIRALDDDEDSNIDFGNLMIDTIPDGFDLPVRYLEANINVDAMDMPKFERVSASQLTIDIWKLSFTIPEHSA